MLSIVCCQGSIPVSRLSLTFAGIAVVFYVSAQPTFQRRINVVSTLWINVEIMLIRRWKWNKIRRQIFNVTQRWYNVSARRWNNVKTTLHNVVSTLIQRFILVSTLVKAILNPIGLVIMDLQIDFYYAKWGKIFYYILTIQLLIKHQKIF